MFKRKVTLPVSQNYIHVDVVLKNGRQDTIVLCDHLGIQKDKFIIRSTALEQLEVSKTNETAALLSVEGEILHVRDIASFGRIEHLSQVVDLRMKKNLFTQELSWT